MAARRGLDERGDALTVEAGDLHARDAFETVELGERLVEGVVDVGRRLAMRGDQTQAQRQRRAEPVQHQLQRGPAGPLEVVQHEQDGCAPAGIDDEVGDGVEVRDARILAERQLGRVVRVVRIGLQQCARPLRVGVDDAQVVGVGEQVLERVDHRAVRRPTPFPARAEEHGRAVRGGVARELRDEARLARARFAADEHGVAAAVLHRGKRERELIPFRAAGPRTGSTARCAAVPGAAR